MAEPGASTVYYSGCPSFSKPPAALKAAQALYEAGFAILVQRRRGPNWFDYTIIKRVKPVAAKAPEPVGRR